jgi:hypothetical protein
MHKTKPLQSLAQIFYFRQMAKNNRAIIYGATDKATWDNAPIKILWLLKEAHGDGGWNCKAWLKGMSTGDSSYFTYSKWQSTFLPIAKASWQVIADTPFDKLPKEPRDCCKSFRHIAYLNVLNKPGKSRTPYSRLKEGFGDGKKLFKRIKALKPDVVIGGNTLWLMYANENFFLKNEINKTILQGGWWFRHDNILYIDHYHPQNISVKKRDYCNWVYGLCKTQLENYPERVQRIS